jgi:hypothetical protein
MDDSMSESVLTAGSHSTYEIRYSTSPITNANFTSATLIAPELYATSVNAGLGGRIQRTTTDSKPAWTQFAIPSGTVSANSKLYFAVKDVSATGSGDGHNSPNSNIKTIDYSLTSSSDTTAPSAPSGLSVL